VNDLEYHLYEEAKAGRMTRQQLLIRGSVLGLSASAMSAILAACGTSASSPSNASTGSTSGNIKRGGTFNLGVTQPAQDVDPVTMYNEGAIATSNIAGEYLAMPKPDYSLDPRLATKWETPDAGKTWNFTIRQGVQFQDGTPMTVDDVVATFLRLTDPKSQSAALSAFGGVLGDNSVESTAADTVTFHLQRAYADFPYLVSAFNYNTIILPKNYKVGQFTKGNVGTGAFILTSFHATQGATFKKNPNYWMKGMPYVDALNLKYFSDTPPQIPALQTGDIDAMVETPYTDAKALFGNANIVVLENPSSQYRTLQMRVDQQPFSDLNARLALAYSLDRPALVQTLFGGKAQLGNDHAFAPIYPDSPSTADVPQRVQDISKGKSLLGGKTVNVTLTTEQYLEIPQYAQLIKSDAAKVGINVQLNVEPQGTFYGSGANQPWLQVPFGITDWAARGFPGQTIDPAYLCSSVPNKNLSNAGAWNSAHWCNPEFTNLVHQFEAEVDQQKRAALAIQAAKLQQSQVPDVIAYWIDELRAVNKKVNNFPKAPITQVDARGVWLS
jgi:peptide/nickel transport system substrate-binding protein